MGNIAIIATFSLSIVYAIIYRPRLPWKAKGLWFFYGFFLIYLISALSSHDITQGLHKLETKLMFLLLPYSSILVMSFRPSLDKILRYFALAMVILSCVLLLNNGIKFFLTGNYNQFFFHDFTALYRQHAVYFSVLVLFASIIFLEFNSRITLFNLLNVLVLGITLFFAASKIMIMLFVISLIYYSFFRQKSKYFKLMVGSVFLLGLLIIGFSSVLQERFVEGLNFSNTEFELENRQFTYQEKKEISDVELRILLGKIGWQHMVKDKKIMLGYGLGDQQDWFDYHLMRYNLAPNWYEGDNVHNQYLDIWLNLGLLGLIYFFGMLIYFLRKAIQSKNRVWLFYTLIFLIIFLFEVYLNRNKGIIFFTLFTMLFYSHYLYAKKYKNLITE